MSNNFRAKVRVEIRNGDEKPFHVYETDFPFRPACDRQCSQWMGNKAMFDACLAHANRMMDTCGKFLGGECVEGKETGISKK